MTCLTVPKGVPQATRNMTASAMRLLQSNSRTLALCKLCLHINEGLVSHRLLCHIWRAYAKGTWSQSLKMSKGIVHREIRRENHEWNNTPEMLVSLIYSNNAINLKQWHSLDVLSDSGVSIGPWPRPLAYATNPLVQCISTVWPSEVSVHLICFSLVCFLYQSRTGSRFFSYHNPLSMFKCPTYRHIWWLLHLYISPENIVYSSTQCSERKSNVMPWTCI